MAMFMVLLAVYSKQGAHLEGATPTRVGPRPRNRERGPSFSRINLGNNGNTVRLRSPTNTLDIFNSNH